MTGQVAYQGLCRPVSTGYRRLRVIAYAALILAGTAGPALAHSAEGLTDHTAWKAWDLTPDMVIPSAFVLAIYVNGAVRRSTVARRTPLARHLLFFAGLASVFLALQSPIDAIADRLFFVHQIQHLLLRMLGPMLLALSGPEGLLTAGLPRVVRRYVLAPVASNGVARGLIWTLGHPAIALILFVAALYVWEVPRLHDFAVLNDGVHYVMHITMLLAGLLFWWVIFSRRTPKSPLDMDDDDRPWWRRLGRRSAYGPRYGVRIMLLGLVILSNILLGAVTALKSVELYPVYDLHARLFGYAPITDEQIGGFIIWVPSSMMCVAAALIVLRRLGIFERQVSERARARAGSNSVVLLQPTTAAQLIAQARPKNRAMALALSVFVLSIFTTVMILGVLLHSADAGGLRALRADGRLLARSTG
jgi:putative membrane protein